MKKILPGLLLLLFTLPLAAATTPASGVALLKLFLNDVDTLKADFVQTVLDAQLAVTESSQGTLLLARPGKFRWDYIKPYEQIIVADGKNLWIYDKLLEQVTVKPLSSSLASSPAMLLSGVGSLEDSFELQDMGQQGELVWVKLIPRVQDSDFEAVRVGFENSQVAIMELTDKLGQTTRIEFNNVQRNPALPADAFVFTPPEGADVIGTPAP